MTGYSGCPEYVPCMTSGLADTQPATQKI